MPTLYCPQCGYNLTALTENRCPECGEAFDLQVIRQQLSQGISTRSIVRQLIFVPVGIAFFVLPVVVYVLGSFDLRRNGQWIVTIAIMVLSAAGVALANAYSLAHKFIKDHKIRHGADNTAWIFRLVWPWCVLFTFIESCLATAYFFVGCWLIFMAIVPRW